MGSLRGVYEDPFPRLKVLLKRFWSNVFLKKNQIQTIKHRTYPYLALFIQRNPVSNQMIKDTSNKHARFKIDGKKLLFTNVCETSTRPYLNPLAANAET